MTDSKLWRTKSGVLVRQDGEIVDGKIYAFRYPTGGFHGWLHVRHLTPAKDGA